MAKANQGSKPINLADREYDAANAEKAWGFKNISRFDELPDTTKRILVSHNMKTLKNLPSRIRMPIVKRCMQNKSDDFVGLKFLAYYVPCQENHVSKNEPKKAIPKKRPSVEFTDSRDEEDNWTPPEKKSEKEKEVLEKIKSKETEQQNLSREYLLKNKVHAPEKAIRKKRSSVECTDSGEEEENWTPPKKKREKKKEVLEKIKSKKIEQQNLSREYFLKNKVCEPEMAILKKRSSVECTGSGEKEENWTPPEKKSEKEKEVLEEIKSKRLEQQNPSREYLLKNKVPVKYAVYEEEEEEKWTPPKKKRGKKKARVKTEIPRPAPELPEKIKSKIENLNGTDINWVITKRLFSSDVASNNGRFSMPLNQIDIGFLTDDERERLDKRKDIDGETKGIEVGMVGPTGELSRLVLKKWRMEKPNGTVIIVYNLITGWYKNIVKPNGLKIDQLVHAWSFREGKNLSFALVKVDEQDE